MAVYVTDTHPLLWYATEAYSKLSPAALRVFRLADRGAAFIWVPAMSLWEAGMLERMRRVRFRIPFRAWADALLAQPCYGLAALDTDDVYAALNTQLRADVFDMAIVAAARARDLPLITKDHVITESKAVEVLW